MNPGFLLFVVFLFFMTGCASAILEDAKPGQYPKTFRTESIKCSYLVYTPDAYPEGDKAWPLLLFLHGAGERGDNLDLVKIHGPPRLVEEGRAFPFVIVSPQCPKGIWWSLDVLQALVDDLVKRYRIDEQRIYLTGLSMGGYGTWGLATACPSRFAAIAPICGGGEPEKAHRLKDVPVWVFHGARDEVVPVKESEKMVFALKACGGRVDYTVYPEAGHDSWTETYGNPALYEWFLKHRREQGGDDD